MRFSLSKLEKRALAFVLVTMVIVVGLVWSKTSRQRWFQKQKRFKIVTARGCGLKAGSLVKMSDLEAGIVESVEFNSKNMVVTTFGVYPNFQDRVRKDSRAIIVAPPILGNVGISITPGSLKSPRLKDGAVIPCSAPKDLLSSLGSIPEKIDPSLKKLEIVLANIEAITGDIERGRGSLGRILKGEEFYNQLLALLEGSNKVIAGFEPTSLNLAKASERLPQILESAKKTLEGLQRLAQDLEQVAKRTESITEKIDKGEGTVGKLVSEDAIYEKAKSTLSSAESILGKVKQVKIKTSTGMDTAYYGKQDLLVSKVYSRLSSNPKQYLQVGGAFFSHKRDKVQGKPELLFGQKLPQGYNIRAGVLEGNVGVGIDYNLPGKDMQLTLEGRKTSNKNNYDQNLDSFLLRSWVGIKVKDYLRLNLGVDNILDKPGFSSGIILGK